MALDPRYITSVELQSYFVDKDTGLPLSGGLVYFWEDNNRNQLKNVYQLSGSPPNYQFSPLPNPLTLSGVGTFMDDNGNDIAVYYFPYDDFGNVQLYFIQVYAAGMPPPGGVPQFTREAWPGTIEGSNTPGAIQSGFDNELSNPQFAEVLFDINPNNPLLIPYTVGSYAIDIAPDWKLLFTASGAGTIEVNRDAFAGTSNFPTQPPYWLSIQNGSNLTSINLAQRLYQDAGIWSATNAENGWVASSILLGPGTGTVSMNYVPSSGMATQLLIGNNTGGGAPIVLNNTVQLNPSNNTSVPPNSYVDIIISFAPNAGTAYTFSSVQVVGLDSFVENVAYSQEPVNRQIDHLFHYYKPQLSYKPIPSHLIGWDFPLNPAQLGTAFGPSAIGANSAQYTWDQTIVYQDVTSSVVSSRAPSGALRLTAAVAEPFGIIQYLPATEARSILNQPFSVNIAASCSNANGAGISVNAYYCTDASLPNVNAGTNLSLIATVNSELQPATFNGTWLPVPRGSLGFINDLIQPSMTDDYNDYRYSGWDMQGIPAIDTANYFAIVILFAPIDVNDTIDIYSVGLCSGQIATRPAPMTKAQTLSQCEMFYEKSYKDSDLPGTITNYNSLTAPMNSTIPIAGTFACTMLETAFTVNYRTPKYIPPTQTYPTLTMYSPVSGAAANVSAYVATKYVSGPFGATYKADDPLTQWLAPNFGNKYTSFQPSASATPISTTASGNVFYPAIYTISYHYVVDARLGIVA